MLTIESLFFFPGARALGKSNVASPLIREVVAHPEAYEYHNFFQRERLRTRVICSRQAVGNMPEKVGFTEKSRATTMARGWIIGAVL